MPMIEERGNSCTSFSILLLYIYFFFFFGGGGGLRVGAGYAWFKLMVCTIVPLWRSARGLGDSRSPGSAQVQGCWSCSPGGCGELCHTGRLSAPGAIRRQKENEGLEKTGSRNYTTKRKHYKGKFSIRNHLILVKSRRKKHKLEQNATRSNHCIKNMKYWSFIIISPEGHDIVIHQNKAHDMASQSNWKSRGTL